MLGGGRIPGSSVVVLMQNPGVGVSDTGVNEVDMVSRIHEPAGASGDDDYYLVVYLHIWVHAGFIKRPSSFP